MGLVSAGVSLLSRVGGFLGIGAARAGAGAGLAGLTSLGAQAARLGGRAAIGPFGQALAGGAIGAGIVGGFGGDGAAPGLAGGQLGQLVAAGAMPTALAGGRFLVTAPNGDVQIFNRNGQAIKPQLIIPAGQRLPGGSVVVSTRQGGALIGITKRRRRKRFGAEIRNVRKTVQAAQSLVKLCKPSSRRS